MHKKTVSQKEKTAGDNFIKVITGSIITSLMFFLLIIIGAIIILKFDLKSEALPAVAFISSALSAFSGGYISVRRIRKNGAALGALTSAPAAAAVLIAVIISSGKTPGINMLIAAVIMIISGAAGGIISVNSKQKGNKTIRKR